MLDCSLFFRSSPSRSTAATLLEAQSHLPYSYPDVGATASHIPPRQYVVDHNRVQLGWGEHTFVQACAALRAWTMFDLGWIDLLWPNAPITEGTTVGVLAHLPGVHILNACRIVYLIDETQDDVTRVGFAYGTLPGHIERGEERFTVAWHHRDDRVWYEILAFSQPNHWLVKLGYPVARFYQRRFARASMHRMQQATRSTLQVA